MPPPGQTAGDGVEMPLTLVHDRYRVLVFDTVTDAGYHDYIDLSAQPDYVLDDGTVLVKRLNDDVADVLLDDRWLRLLIEHGEPFRITPAS